MRVLVTGCGGFVGPWLTRELVAHGHVVVGTALDATPAELVEGGVLLAADLRVQSEVDAIVKNARADACIHLAGMSHVGDSWQFAADAIDANATVAVRVAKALDVAGTRRFVQISTSEVYGIVKPEALPLTESSPLRPANPYAAAKLAGEEMLRVLAPTMQMSITIARPFSHTGPGQITKFVCPSFAEQVARVMRGELDEIAHGDLSAKRDFSDVRDVCAAYRLLLDDSCAGRTVNIASGKSYAISEVLAMLLELAGLPETRARLDPARLRPIELPELRGDASPLHAATGWTPRHALRDTLADLLKHFSHGGSI